MVEALQTNGTLGPIFAITPTEKSGLFGGGSPHREKRAVIKAGTRGLESPVVGGEISGYQGEVKGHLRNLMTLS
jgi:hypothetical protein